MAIENPAAIFSAEGLKMFIEALTGGKNELVNNFRGDIGSDNISDNQNDVDSLVQEYKKYKEGPEKMEKVTELVTSFLGDLEVKETKEIVNFLNEKGYEYTLRGINPLMRGVMKRNGLIEKFGPTSYCLRTGE
jgi:hypothetical protein